MTPLPPASDDAIRALATDILSRSAYARWRPQQSGWVLELLRQLQTWLQAWSGWMRELSLARPWLYAGIVGALVLLAAALLAHLVYALRVALAAGRAPVQARHETDAPGFLAEAEALSGHGRFLEAAHHMQLAVIDLLLRRRALELSRSDPNRTLRLRLQTAALPKGERGELLVLLDRLEKQWFRDRAEDRDLYDAWRRLHERLQMLPEPM